ncbi:hypothetical protein [Paraburkholderia aromaticivorans]|uniref:hypothetical protein n=1 Tax=Paraburkholderia aromaticivorans TaxID=2026199 RepID=UPI0038B8DF9C
MFEATPEDFTRFIYKLTDGSTIETPNLIYRLNRQLFKSGVYVLEMVTRGHDPKAYLIAPDRLDPENPQDYLDFDDGDQVEFLYSAYKDDLQRYWRTFPAQYRDLQIATMGKILSKKEYAATIQLFNASISSEKRWKRYNAIINSETPESEYIHEIKERL